MPDRRAVLKGAERLQSQHQRHVHLAALGGGCFAGNGSVGELFAAGEAAAARGGERVGEDDDRKQRDGRPGNAGHYPAGKRRGAVLPPVGEADRAVCDRGESDEDVSRGDSAFGRVLLLRPRDGERFEVAG